MGKALVVGSFITDLTALTHKLPVPGETVLGYSFTAGPGGKGGNQAVQAARLGASVSIVTKIGNDVFGKEALSHFEKEGIETDWISTSDQEATGTALIAVEDSGENMIVVTPGACGQLSKKDVEKAEAAFRKTDIVVVQLETSMEAVEEAVWRAAAERKPLLLNPAPYQEIPEHLLEHVSYITPNETEASAITGINVGDEASAAEAARIIRKKGIPNVIITLGKKGCFISSGNEEYILPSEIVKAVDTTGAGDSFTGALAAELAEGKSLRDACGTAVKAAGLSVARYGTSPAMPWREEIL
ncbi:MAG: ribokinase [Alkalicoccus sp.]|nr:MAG: ribokinase [Alkalicoccus sp.]